MIKLFVHLYKVFKYLRIISYLNSTRILSIIIEKHQLLNFKQPHFITVFVGNYGGYSIIVGAYYINIDKNLFFCNFRKVLKNYQINYKNISYSLNSSCLFPIALMESILLENNGVNKTAFQMLSSDKESQGLVYAFIKAERPEKVRVFEKSGNFFHFYFETVSHVLQCNDGSTNIYFLIGKHSFYSEILKYYGINYSLVKSVPDNISKSSMLYSKYYPFSKDIIWLYKYNKARFCSTSEAPCRLYISRRNEKQRRILNETSLLKKLESFDFLVINPGELQYRDQVRLFRNAKIIVGAHGAAFSNLVWCNNNVKIIELNGNKDVRWHFAKISTMLGFNYKLLIGKTISQQYFHIDENMVLNEVKAMLQPQLN